MNSIQRVAADRLAPLYGRLALGSAFLSAVAGRFGLWDKRSHPFAQFIRYTGEVLSFMPRFTIPFLAVASTVAETALGLLLIAGIRLRWTAPASAILLAVFAISMAISLGIKSPLDESVFSASAAALLLALHHVDGAGAGPGSTASAREMTASQSGLVEIAESGSCRRSLLPAHSPLHERSQRVGPNSWRRHEQEAGHSPERNLS